MNAREALNSMVEALEKLGFVILSRSEVEEKDKEIAALRELVDSAEGIFTSCSVTEGVCCCGDNMETHADPMSCGHEPIDHGAFLVAIWLESRDVVVKDAK